MSEDQVRSISNLVALKSRCMVQSKLHPQWDASINLKVEALNQPNKLWGEHPIFSKILNRNSLFTVSMDIDWLSSSLKYSAHLSLISEGEKNTEFWLNRMSCFALGSINLIDSCIELSNWVSEWLWRSLWIMKPTSASFCHSYSRKSYGFSLQFPVPGRT